MIYLEAQPSIASAVKRVYMELFPSGLTPFDEELQREDSATIVIEPSRGSRKEAVSVSANRLVYQYNYERLFPYAKEIKPDTGEDIVAFEMRFWNEDLMLPKEDAPEGQLQRVVHLLKTKPSTRRAIINLWKNSEHATSPFAPCVTHMVFRNKDGDLEMHSHLRTNDICFLLFMDMQVMSGVHKSVAEWLGLRKGRYVHFVDSLHYHKKYCDLVRRQYAFMLTDRAWRNA